MNKLNIIIILTILLLVVSINNMVRTIKNNDELISVSKRIASLEKNSKLRENEKNKFNIKINDVQEKDKVVSLNNNDLIEEIKLTPLSNKSAQFIYSSQDKIAKNLSIEDKEFILSEFRKKGMFFDLVQKFNFKESELIIEKMMMKNNFGIAPVNKVMRYALTLNKEHFITLLEDMIKYGYYLGDAIEVIYKFKDKKIPELLLYSEKNNPFYKGKSFSLHQFKVLLLASRNYQLKSILLYLSKYLTDYQGKNIDEFRNLIKKYYHHNDGMSVESSIIKNYNKIYFNKSVNVFQIN